MRTLVSVVVIMMGLVLMIGGIVTGKHGATVIGLIVAAVVTQQWLQWNKRRQSGNTKEG